MSVYIIAQIDIGNRSEYDIYEEGFDAVFSKYKGMLMSVDEEPVILEGEWPCTRTVLITFRSQEDARNWFYSPEYQQLAAHRRAAGKGNIVMVKRLGK
jgi:uncharacterized protein (DUF1330 family)